MNTPVRIIATGLTALSMFYFTYWIGGAMLMMAGVPPTAMLTIALLVGIGVALAAATFVWRSKGASGLLSSVTLGAVLTGTVGFAIGFFGPLLFMRGGNIAPLLGILVTGPLGVILGAVGGAIYWMVRGLRSGPTQRSVES